MESAGMAIQFNYVYAVSDFACNLHLFKAADGDARGNVRGPMIDEINGCKIFADVAEQQLDAAFASAIRMANCGDVEMVISGDRRLWNPAWGNLVD
jgi:hypothetical protein